MESTTKKEKYKKKGVILRAFILTRVLKNPFRILNKPFT